MSFIIIAKLYKVFFEKSTTEKRKINSDEPRLLNYVSGNAHAHATQRTFTRVHTMFIRSSPLHTR